MLESGRKYATELRDILTSLFPQAAITVNFDNTTSGARTIYQATNSDEVNEEVQDILYYVSSELFSEASWQVAE